MSNRISFYIAPYNLTFRPCKWKFWKKWEWEYLSLGSKIFSKSWILIVTYVCKSIRIHLIFFIRYVPKHCFDFLYEVSCSPMAWFVAPSASNKNTRQSTTHIRFAISFCSNATLCLLLLLVLKNHNVYMLYV